MARKLQTQANGNLTPSVIVRNWVGGEERDATGGVRFDSRSASNQVDVVGTAPLSGMEDVEAACRAAAAAYPAWSATPAPVRGEIVGRIGEAISHHKELLSKLVCREIGKSMKESRGEVQEVIDTAHFFQSEGRRLYGQTVHSEMPNKELFTYRRSLGVAGMITAGNFPIAVPSWKILPAILTGNTVVWKPSEDAPVIAYLFGRIMEEAGVPAGVVNIVHGAGGGGAGEAILACVDKGLIQKISFTGSTAVGRKVGEVCGRNLQIPSLELGGKNPMVVLRDANIDVAVEGALFSGYGTAGQRCTSLGNLILDKPIAAEFKARLLKRLSEIKIGDVTKSEDVLYGPMINQRFYENFMKHFEMGKADGARLLTEKHGRITKENAPANFVGDPDAGYYVFPTLWEGVTADMKLSQTEIFGPVVTVMEVDGFAEALAAANCAPYGLSSSCYTMNPTDILRFKNGIHAGMTSINNTTNGAEAHMPFGGVGWSGNGTRESGVWVIDAYTRWHAVNEDLAGKLQLAQMDVDFGETKEPTDLSFLA
ncbi:MAG: aldehyde dehydrogenase family protein [Myxococcales bacterium]|nr:aldehyde dehydrogenase family protein [Myxococcales bacterium]MCB9645325.1 aldehyde dehydrogenase family protein [Deltaproteobacteria bacterium]